MTSWRTALMALRSGQPLPSPQVLIERIRRSSAAPATWPECCAEQTGAGWRGGAGRRAYRAGHGQGAGRTGQGDLPTCGGKFDHPRACGCNNDAQVALNEMQTTLEWMVDQLRRLDSEPRAASIIVSTPRVTGWPTMSLIRWKWIAIRCCSNCPGHLVECRDSTCSTSRPPWPRNRDAQGLLQKQAR